MNKILKFKENLKIINEKIADFIQTENKSQFYIIDNKGDSEIINFCENIEKCFFIDNQNNYEINFIPVDGKNGLLGFGESYCDCVIFNKDELCFLEFKFNATSLEIRAINKNRKKAILQLANTIDFFDNKLNKNYSG